MTCKMCNKESKNTYDLEVTDNIKISEEWTKIKYFYRICPNCVKIIRGLLEDSRRIK